MKKKKRSDLDMSLQPETSLHDWIEKQFEDERNEPLLKQTLKDKWADILGSQTPSVDLKHILYRIHFNINVRKGKRSVPAARHLYSLFSKIAAVFILPLLGISIYLALDKFQKPVQFAEIMAPKGEKVKFVLPDGSSGYLNSGSTLKYSYPFYDNRLVELNGEGFFDVVHDKRKFIVQTGDVKIVVHGTRFNVCAYDDDSQVVTTLEQGSVTVTGGTEGEELTINPGQQAVFNKMSREVMDKNVDVDLFVSWKDNMLRFHDTPFLDVVRKMERWYDVKILLDDKLKFTQRYTMTIKTESLREMLELMLVTTPMKYEVKEDLVYITYKQ
ncbi:MAG: FecR family protein [Mangrovibacterium sp.]